MTKVDLSITNLLQRKIRVIKSDDTHIPRSHNSAAGILESIAKTLNVPPMKKFYTSNFSDDYKVVKPLSSVSTGLRYLAVNYDIDVQVPDFLLKAELQGGDSPWLRVPIGRDGLKKTLQKLEYLFYPELRKDVPVISADIPDLEKVVFATAKNLCSSPEESQLVKTIIEIASELNKAHPQTFQHLLRVAYLTHKFGESLNLNKTELLRRLLGAILHDIGKMDPEVLKVLDLPRALSPDERAVINKHPDIGFYMARDKKIPDKLVSLLEILQHHMWLVQSKGGYPKRSPGENISPEANALHLADVFDALTGKGRNYRVPSQPTAALKLLIRGEGVEFEQSLTKRFVELIGYDCSALKDEIRNDEYVLKELLRGTDTVYDKTIVEKLIGKNEYNVFALRKEIELEEQATNFGVQKQFAMRA